MSQGQIIILDCQGETKPAICFNLEVGGYRMRIVRDEDEAINLLNNTRLTNEQFSGLLVNNPYLNVDISKIVEEVHKTGIDIPVIFVKDSANLKKIVADLSLEYTMPRIYHAEPTRVVALLSTLQVKARAEGNGF